MSLSDTTGILGVNIMSICKKDTPSKSAQNLGGKSVKLATSYAGFLHRTWAFCWGTKSLFRHPPGKFVVDQ